MGSFKGVGELKTILKADRNAFAEGVTDKLLTYALGRGLEKYDRPTVRQIAKREQQREIVAALAKESGNVAIWRQRCDEVRRTGDPAFDEAIDQWCALPYEHSEERRVRGGAFDG